MTPYDSAPQPADSWTSAAGDRGVGPVGHAASRSGGSGWLLAAIWVLFLVYPLIASFTSPAGLPWQIASVLITLAFGVCYVLSMRQANELRNTPVTAGSLYRLLVLLGLAFATVPTIGINALGFGPFLVAYAALTLPRLFAAWVFAAVIGLAITVPALAGELEQWWFLSLVILLTGVTTGVVRVAAERVEQGEVVKEQLAVVAERERVARDVHDVLGHSLTVISLKAELAERLTDSDLERARQELRDIKLLSREALAEVRATVGGLRVARLGDELRAARQALASAGVRADVPQEADVVDPRYRIIFAWVLREAITNVVRHAAARTCTVRLEPSRLTVTDDGRGRCDQFEGNGLRGLRERVEAAAGRLEVRPAAAGTGTTLRVEM